MDNNHRSYEDFKEVLDVHLMILFLAVLATAPPVDTSLSLGGHLENLCSGVCLWCRRVRGEKKGVYSDREEAEEGGNITAINIKKDSYDSISQIRLR